MIQALLRGKLAEDQEHMEDILTSNVFGLLQFAPRHLGLFPFLSRARAIDGSRPLDLLGDSGLFDDANVSLEFWPFWSQPQCISCEPDVVIRIRLRTAKRFLILIEAKYLSGKSSEADEGDERPNDQLAREWDNLVRIAEREDFEPCLIYVTADIGIPKAEIEASLSEYRQKRPDDQRVPAILALSWREIPEVFHASGDPILRSLCELAMRLGLVYFHGFHISNATHRLSWHFNPFPPRWTQISCPPQIRWRFQL